MSIFAFRPEPTGTGMTGSDLISSGLDSPMSLGSTLWEMAKEVSVHSPGLGTAIRSVTLPAQAPTKPALMFTPEQGGEPIRVPDTAQMRRRVFAGGGTLRPETPEELTGRQQQVGAITREQYKSSPSFRDDVPWDEGMTEERASALAAQHDLSRVRQYYAQKRPVTAFMGSLLGSATDPINYIPIFGEAVAAANVGRFGYIAGRAVTASADAMVNTAIAELATAPARGAMGDDVTWQTTMSQVAMSGLIGVAFGSGVGVYKGRQAGRLERARDQLSTLKRVQESRVVLNDAIDGLARNGEVRLSEASKAFVERAGRDTDELLRDVTYAPEMFDESLRATVGEGQFAPRIDEVTGVEGFTVYHGSPHEFDRFSMEHIGKGEGAQAYGHGLYFAENEGVAKEYKNTLSRSDNTWTVDGEVVGKYGQNSGPLGMAAAQVRQARGSNGIATAVDVQKAIDTFQGIHQRNKGMLPKASIDAAIEEMRGLVGKNVGLAGDGHTYQVRIRAKSEDFLDWDKPLSEQSEKVKAALEAIGFKPTKSPLHDEPTGSDFIQGLSARRSGNMRSFENDPSVTRQLREAGIPGIKYLDQGSRGAGEGSRNYVLFDDALIHTTRRNDELLNAATAGKAEASFTANAYSPDDIRPEPARLAANAQIGKPDDIKAMSEQYRVNPETGEFAEQDELEQLIAEGRVSKEDEADLLTADENFKTATAFGEALKAAMTCVM